jgi:hypothetical protein
MAITRKPTPREVGEVFAKRIGREPIVRELWVTEFDHYTHLWLLIDPTDDTDTEGKLYTMTDELWDRFPEGEFIIRIWNPLHHSGDPRRAYGDDAVQIPLRAG